MTIPPAQEPVCHSQRAMVPLVEITVKGQKVTAGHKGAPMSLMNIVAHAANEGLRVREDGKEAHRTHHDG